MRPMGRKLVRFPGKTDCHPPKGYVNWWEAEICTEGKKTDRANSKKEIEQALANEALDERSASNGELGAGGSNA